MKIRITFAACVIASFISLTACASMSEAIPNKDVERDTSQPLIFTVVDVQDDNDDSFLDVSPVTLYKMLIEEKKKVHSLAQSVMMMRERIMKEQREDADRLTELERIVSGLQKQVTILHGKKVDKPAKKSAKPNAIPIVTGDGENVSLVGQHAPHKIMIGPGVWGPYCDGFTTTETKPWQRDLYLNTQPIAGSNR